jgi:hypothetical protein
VIAALVLTPAPGRAQSETPSMPQESSRPKQTMTMEEANRRYFHTSPVIYPGTVELGLSLALVSLEGETHSSFGVRLGKFQGASDGLIGYEAGISDTRGDGVHVIDYDGELSWSRPLQPGIYPFLAAGGGWRTTRVNGTKGTSYPVGGAIGFRALVGERAALRAEYRYRRVMDDPVADFSENQVWVSFSVLFANRAPKAK